MEERRVGLEEVVLHIEDERRVAEDGPRCKPRVPQIASPPRPGSVVTPPTHPRACLFTRFLQPVKIHLYSQIYHLFSILAQYFVDKYLRTSS